MLYPKIEKRSICESCIHQKTCAIARKYTITLGCSKWNKPDKTGTDKNNGA